jgi:hypothetical protein
MCGEDLSARGGGSEDIIDAALGARRPRNSTPPRTGCTGIRRATSFTATTIATAICRCTFQWAASVGRRARCRCSPRCKYRRAGSSKRPTSGQYQAANGVCMEWQRTAPTRHTVQRGRCWPICPICLRGGSEGGLRTVHLRPSSRCHYRSLPRGRCCSGKSDRRALIAAI